MDHGWANRCLPLLMANESGWVLLNSQAFTATWTGDRGKEAIRIEFDDADASEPWTRSLFGYGILTWTIPFLFRTPPGWNLLVRGPANWPKDGACALEGLVESDWSVATFTMNWKFTRPGHPVRFEAEEPFCMVVPMRRGALECFRPEMRDIRSAPRTRAGFEHYTSGRHDLAVRKFLGEYSDDFADARLEWQQHYFRGLRPDGTAAPEHQTRLTLADFRAG